MELFNLVDGANVAVIGGYDEIDWDMVAQMDYVARINSHWVRQRGRCDILYFSCASDLDYAMFNDDEFLSGIKIVMLNHAQLLFGGYAGTKTKEVIRTLAANRITVVPYLHAPAGAWKTFTALRDMKCWTRDLAERYNFHPLTGVLAVEHLLLSPAAGVYVTGMSLYQRGGTIPESAGTHHLSPQIQFFQESLIDSRLHLEPSFISLLDNNPPDA